MATISRILCPIDFSDRSGRAFDYALALARWYGASVSVLHVHQPTVPTNALAPLAPAPPSLVPPIELDLVRRHVEAFVSHHRDTGRRIESQAAEGDPAREILAAAASADLIVMGTHGRSGVERFVLGSVTETVLREAPCSVLTIPVTARDAGSVPIVFRRIVAAVDFSDTSIEALRHAAALARDVDAHLTVLHVIEVPENLALWIDRADCTSHVHTWVEAAHAYLRAAVNPETRQYADVEQCVETGKAYREILRVATARHADLVVLGAHGHGVIEQMFVGSTAQHVIRSASCPVLVVRQGAGEESGDS